MRIIAPRTNDEGAACLGFTAQDGSGILASALCNEPFTLDIDDEQLHILTSLGLRVTLVRQGAHEFTLRVDSMAAPVNSCSIPHDYLEDDEDYFEDDYDPFDDGDDFDIF